MKRHTASLAVALVALLGAGCTPQFTPLPTGVPVTVIVTVVLTPTPVSTTSAPLVAVATASLAPATQAPPSPSATAQAPTPTPVPAGATPTPANLTPSPVPPSPTPCPSTIGVGGDFSLAYNGAKLQQELGCPTSGAHTLKTSYEPFEHGFMFWRDDTKLVDVFYGVDNTWQEFADTYVDGQPEYSCPSDNTPSTTPPTPRRGFGKVWCTQPNVRSRLGNALSDEIGNDRTVQDFENGSMLLIPDYAGVPVVLYKDSGRWQLVR